MVPRLHITLLLLICLLHLGVLAQTNNTKRMSNKEVQLTRTLAEQAKNKGEFEKAIEYYESLFELAESEVYYNALVELYPKVEDYKSAEKMVKKRIKKFQEQPEFIVDLGHIYELQGEKKKADDTYSNAVTEANSFDNGRRIANQFLRYDLNAYAEEVYLKVRKRNRNQNLFRYELARAYAQQGKTSEMVDEYLAILGQNDGHLRSVQNVFQRLLSPDPDKVQFEMLKSKLLKKIQNNANKAIYSKLLTWLFIQDKNFDGAFVQAKALDRRLSEDGKRLNSLAALSTSNKRYDIARKCYEYIIELKEKSPFYRNALMKMVSVKEKELFSKGQPSKEELKDLEKEYLTAIQKLKAPQYTFDLNMGLSDLNAFYLDHIDTAVSILENSIEMLGINEMQKARAKLKLGDLMLIKGEIWEASLLYSQVEKAFKYDRLGETAKFKNAKVAFYVGDFYWSQAQLNVLKGSTSKLISNDALDLSLLITDNLGLDSIVGPLSMYARADLLIFKKDFDLANKTLDSIPVFFPLSGLKDDILFSKYKISVAQRDFENARQQLQLLIRDHAEDLLGDDALFALGKLEEEEFQNPTLAMEYYKTIITDYPSSLFVVESRKRFRSLRGDAIEEENEENPKSTTP